MTDDNSREKNVRVNEADLQALKAAKEEYATNVPLGFVARQGAKLLLNESNGTNVKL